MAFKFGAQFLGLDLDRTSAPDAHPPDVPGIVGQLLRTLIGEASGGAECLGSVVMFMTLCRAVLSICWVGTHQAQYRFAPATIE